MPIGLSNRSPLRPAPRRRLLTLAVAALVVAAPVGCGGGSPAPPASSTSTTANADRGGPGGGQRGRVRACLEAHGVTLPRRPSGAPPRGDRGGLLGGPARGNDPALRRAAAACGLQSRLGRRSPQFRTQLRKFVTCVRRHGFKLPPPSTTGKGPVFDPTKMNRSDPKLLTAARGCQALVPRRGGGGVPGGSRPGGRSPGVSGGT